MSPTAGDVRAGGAFVELTLDDTKFMAGVEALVTTVRRSARSVESSLARITSAMALLRITAAAIAGAVEEMKAQRAFNAAEVEGDLSGMVAAYRKVEQAQLSVLRSVPIIGGALASLATAFNDDSIERFTARVLKSSAAVKTMAGALKEMLDAEIEAMKARGAPESEITAKEVARDKRLRDQALADAAAKFQEAKRVRDEAERKSAEANAKINDWSRWTPTGRKRLDEAAIATESSVQAQANFQAADRAWKQMQRASGFKAETEKLKLAGGAGGAGEISGMIEASALAGALPGGITMPTLGAMGSPVATVGEKQVSKLEDIQGTLVSMLDFWQQQLQGSVSVNLAG